MGAHPSGNGGGTAGGNVLFVVFATATPVTFTVTFTFTVISVAKLAFVPLPNMELVDGANCGGSVGNWGGGGSVLTSV